ncbi:hypothetical protein TKK_0010842 [Trichogramma kaykai]|uniref:Bcl-2 Bcl-2 homology region 1-3 domain-containing protein n=1 Tax=Trichogramma kaykai TaxID=54128 RepID=A0ABD2WW65_9HYME
MAGSSSNNESRSGSGTRAMAEQRPHSRVGGQLECNGKATATTTAATTNNNANEAASQRSAANESQHEQQQLCRYGTAGMSFVEIFQIRLQQLFPQLSSPPKATICEDSIELTAEGLANDVIRYLLKEDIYLISRDPISRSMRHNVYQMLNKHSILFTSMVNRLNVAPDTAYEAFMGVADELFHQGVTWSRIVCLYAFMGRMALWARDRRMHSLKRKLPLYVSRYIGEELAPFIKICGGWEQLCLEYPVAEEVSGAVWRSLLVTGATLGLVATILSVTS